MNDVSDNIKSEKQWLRGLFMLLFLIVYEIAEIILIAVTIGQFLFAIVTGKNNANLTQFGDSLGQFVRQIVAYLTYNQEEKPFPFAEWPKSAAAAATSIDTAEDELPPTTGS